MVRFGKKAAPINPGSSAGGASIKSCDVCAVDLRRADGYCLPTKWIVVSELFWRHHFAMGKRVWEPLQLDERQQLVIFTESVHKLAGSKTPWLVCENCSEFFTVDRGKARYCAIEGIDPEGNGPVEPEECVMFAAMAWEQVLGYWPATVEQPSVADSCDLCAKKIYGREIAGSIDRPKMERLRGAGVIDSAPLSPPRSSTGKWVICAGCVARIHARGERLQHRQA
jgi:hypothetical protein